MLLIKNKIHCVLGTQAHECNQLGNCQETNQETAKKVHFGVNIEQFLRKSGSDLFSWMRSVKQPVNQTALRLPAVFTAGLWKFKKLS